MRVLPRLLLTIPFSYEGRKPRNLHDITKHQETAASLIHLSVITDPEHRLCSHRIVGIHESTQGKALPTSEQVLQYLSTANYGIAYGKFPQELIGFVNTSYVSNHVLGLSSISIVE
jgi:hypothetical protein